jgi:hypothetical protein
MEGRNAEDLKACHGGQQRREEIAEKVLACSLDDPYSSIQPKESCMNGKLPYQRPTLVTYGPIGDHTFNNPGEGDKADIVLATDKFGEFSHPAS